MTIKSESRVLSRKDLEVPKQDLFYRFSRPFGQLLDFNYSQGEEVHAIRRKEILKAHPQVNKLMQKTWLGYISFPVLCLSIFVIQTSLAYYLADKTWTLFLLVAYFVGGTVNHSQFVIMHDLTHFTAFQSLFWNKVWAIVVNIPTGIPSAIAFGKHHADHHRYLQILGKDPDIATFWQVNLVQRSWIRKLIFGAILFLPYGVRPLIVHPKAPCTLQLVNMSLTFLYDFCIYYFFGISALLYIILSTLISMSIIHPSTLHILAQHYQYVAGIDTFDYIGPMNIPNLNMGYHIEHHDFPMVPWYNLPKLRELAPEFYDYIPVHTSYLKMLYRFIFDDGIALCTRTVKRP